MASGQEEKKSSFDSESGSHFLQAKAELAAPESAGSSAAPRRPLRWGEEEPDLAPAGSAAASSAAAPPFASCSPEEPDLSPAGSANDGIRATPVVSGSPEEAAAPDQAACLAQGRSKVQHFVGESPIKGLMDSSVLRGPEAADSAGSSAGAHHAGAAEEVSIPAAEGEGEIACSCSLQEVSQRSGKDSSNAIKSAAVLGPFQPTHDAAVSLYAVESKPPKASAAADDSQAIAEDGRAEPQGAEALPAASVAQALNQAGSSSSDQEPALPAGAAGASSGVLQLGPALHALRSRVHAHVQGWTSRVAAAPRTAAAASCTIVCMGLLLAGRRGALVRSLLAALLRAWNAYRARLLRLL